MIWLVLLLLFLLWCGWPSREDWNATRPVTREHKGLEMKARNGRLVYVRETTSEKEL